MSFRATPAQAGGDPESRTADSPWIPGSASLGLAHANGQADLSQMSWLWLTALVGANLFQSGFTRFCPLETILVKLGVAKPSFGGSCA